MSRRKQHNTPATAHNAGLFGSPRILCAAALLAALSIVLGKYMAITTPVFRFSFENLPILMAGIFFGPIIGGTVGLIADLVGCLMVGYTINPIITVGAVLIGILSGTIARIATRKGRALTPFALCLAVAVSHVIGSMIVKSVGMKLYFNTPWETLLWRAPLYVIIGTLECTVLILLTRHKVFMGEISRLIFRVKHANKAPSDVMTYDEALFYIHSVSWKGSRPGLSRTRELCERLGRPQDSLRFIHIAGTNGKGSTSAMLASILQEAGYRVGLYTSPFILRFNERIQINGQPIPDDELAAITSEVRPHAEAMVDTPTEFELITAIALAYFARQNCDVIVFEVGMGGRLDSTNIIDAKTVALSVITGIALDHTDVLGDTPKKIAAEKAGIIKAGVPIVFGGMHPVVGETKLSPDAAVCASAIRKRAAARGARYIQADHSRLTVHHSGIFGSDFDFDGREDLHVSLAGLYQPYNAATALTAVDVLLTRGFDISKEAIRAGLANVRWPGRFEVLCHKPLVIADGGHNPEGIDAAVASMAAYFEDQKIYLLTGVMADKDYAHMIARMKTVASRAFCVRPQNSRALEPERYAAAFQAAGVPAEAFESVEAGVHAAMAAALEDNAALVCLGSLYMYGDVRAAVLAEARSDQ